MRDSLFEAARGSDDPGNSGVPAEIHDAGQLSPEQRAILDRTLPILEIMYLMMVADRDANPLEHDTLRGAMKTLVGDHLADAAIDWVMGEFEASLAREGAASRLQRIGVRLSADREDAESAFALAAAVAVADERVDAKEDQLLAEIAEWLGITAARATSILEENF